MGDKNLVCKDCGAEFVFTEGEQAFYKEKGLANEPQRCADCRRARKAQRNNLGQAYFRIQSVNVQTHYCVECGN